MLPVAGSLEAPLPGYLQPATSWVHYTTSCSTQSSAPEDGRDQRPKHVELIGIINKPLLLHLVSVYIIHIYDARSSKYQVTEASAQNCFIVTNRRCQTARQKDAIRFILTIGTSEAVNPF